MSYFIVEDFRLGQDSRKSNLTAVPGTLTTLTNAHITRGGEIEKRKAFLSQYELPTGTYGMAFVGNALYVFGSATTPAGLPSGVNYQRLQHPSAEAMTGVDDVDVFDGKLYVAATFADGSTYQFYDGTRVTDFVDGRARASFSITAGTNNPGTNKISSIKVNGVEILNTAVDWATSHSATATAVAAQIDSYNSSPEYTAVADGAEVIIIAATGSGTTPNGFTVAVTVGGDVTVSTPTAMSGGSDTALTPGTVVRTFGTKMYTVSGGTLVFSGINTPSDYNDETAVGAGFISIANHYSGSETLTGLEAFYNNMAVFAEEAVQVWFLDADPDNNERVQTIPSTGTTASLSVKNYGDGDVFYLARDGIRALKPRDSSNAAAVTEVGGPIDADVVAYLATLTDVQKAAAVAEIEPVDKRFMLAVGTKIYVYSYFPGSKVAAWSVYEPGFTITDMAVDQGRLYVRAGDTIYLYGGADNATYDDCTVTVEIPYLDMKTPGNPKKLEAIDIVSTGLWTVQMASNPDDPTAYDDIATVNNTTLHKDKIEAVGVSPFFSFKFTHAAEEAATLSRFVAYFEKQDAKAA